MALVVQVPANTVVADLDASLRALLKRELAAQGYDGVEFSFEAPSREWSGQLSVPTVNLFLYDLRESEEHRLADWETRTGPGGPVDVRPPMRLDLSYAVTAWTREVEDEHRLLSQVVSILFTYPVLPGDVLSGGLAEPANQPYPLTTAIGRPRKDGGPEFWTALGASYKASIDCRVTVTIAGGATLARGPEVRTPTVRIRDADRPRARAEERRRVGGRVVDAQGAGVADAWVVVGDGRGLALTGPDGRFVVEHVPDGTHTLQVRAADGTAASIEVTLPGPVPDLVLAPAARRGTRRR